MLRCYNQHGTEMENGSFTPLVLACTSSMSKECTKFYSCLGEFMSIKNNIHNNTVMGWLSAKLFSSEALVQEV